MNKIMLTMHSGEYLSPPSNVVLSRTPEGDRVQLKGLDHDTV